MISNFTVNKLKAAWRNYSPGGKRRKIVRLPFMGQINNNIKAQGTKRIGVVPRAFNRHNLSEANFMAPPMPQPYGYPPPTYPPQYPPQYPQQAYAAPYPAAPYNGDNMRQAVRQSSRARNPVGDANRIYRSGIDTSKELRGWKRELDPVRAALRQNRLDQ